MGIRRWPKSGAGQAAISAEWSADGKHSLKLDAGTMGSFKDLAVSDWTGYATLRFVVHNPNAATAGLGVEVQDEHDGFDDRHQHTFGAPSGDHVIELDFAGGLWRGEENRPYRGSVKGPIDIARITRLAFTNHGEGPLYIDRVELAKVPPIATPGGFAFDFGRAGKQVMGQTIGVFESTMYAADRGFGLLGPATSIERAMSYPTPLLGDGLALGDAGFRVDLPGGAYRGWIAFERGGFWEGEQSSYAHADVLVNRAVVAGHDFDRGAAHFLFEDVEVSDVAQIEDKLVRPAHAITRFRFHAAAGANVITIAAPGASSPPRVAGLFLAPETPEGLAFLDQHEQRQRDAIAASYPPEDRGRRGLGRAPPSALVAEPVAIGAPVYPRDLPEHPAGAPLPEVLAITGRSAASELALYAPAELAVHAEVSALEGPSGAKLPPPRVMHGRYMPTRPLGNGPVWITISHFRPEADFHVAPDLARAVVFEWRVPRDAAPGVYTGSARFTAGDVRLEIPLRVRVFAVDLPDVPIPVALFMNALPFGADVVGEARWWELQEALLDEQARAGLNAVTGGADLYFDVKRDAEAVGIGGERVLRYLDLARARGMGRAAITYGGFFAQLRAGWIDAGAFAHAWSAFASEHALPPFYFNAYDEPGTAAEIASATASVTPFTQAGLLTMGFTTRHKDERAREKLIDATYAPVLNGHEPADIADLARRGRHPWVYGNGLDRYGMGLHLWRNARAGVEGRLEWIGILTQGFAFDDLDGREPGLGAWLVHDRLGLMPTSRWLAAREGLLDLRIRLALEKAVPPGDPALETWSAEGYGSDRDRWTDAALEASRRAMLERLAIKR